MSNPSANKTRCVVVGELCHSVAGRGLVSGSRRNEVQEGDVRKTMAARGLVNGRVPTKWEGFSFTNVTLLNLPVYK